ncbi:MAG TPA: chorismate mutase [Sphaerochaeta sp.]|nr:chorismate mutase [Sphaerochaeta sp.]
MINNPLISAVRGAICVPSDDPALIEQAVCKLYSTLLDANGIQETDIACLLLTQTSDLKSRNPAGGLRKGGYCALTPLFCMQELEIEGMLERVIRILVISNRAVEKARPIFLDGAEKLRPDLANLGNVLPS